MALAAYLGLLQSLPAFSHCLLLCAKPPSASLSYKTRVIALRADLDNPGHSPRLTILNLVTFADSLFPNKVTFTGSRDWHVDFPAYQSIHYRM